MKSGFSNKNEVAIDIARRALIWQIISLPALAWSADVFSQVPLGVFGQDSGTSSLPNNQLLGRVYSAFGLSGRPGPVRIPRISLFRPFAVLLMRSSYEVADDLDFVPMDRFQKEFFLLRADEWERYRPENDAKQGDLSDAVYFDFISAAQYATITKIMRNDAQDFFEERVGAEGTKQLVRRDPSVSNAMLPSLFIERVGDRVLDGLLANFTGPTFFSQPPPPCPPSLQGGAGGDMECIVAGMRQLYAVLGENGYARAVEVADAGDVDAGAYVQVGPVQWLHMRLKGGWHEGLKGGLHVRV
jgi:hypothetical protein